MQIHCNTARTAFINDGLLDSVNKRRAIRKSNLLKWVPCARNNCIQKLDGFVLHTDLAVTHLGVGFKTLALVYKL